MLLHQGNGVGPMCCGSVRIRAGDKFAIRDYLDGGYQYTRFAKRAGNTQHAGRLSKPILPLEEVEV